MFQDSTAGTTHYENDGCGEPAHNGYKDKEIVICAAVKTNTGKIFRGHRHNDCFDAIHSRRFRASSNIEDQGFITSRNRYVTRKEGLKIQLAAGIKSEDPEGYKNELYSEDLY